MGKGLFRSYLDYPILHKILIGLVLGAVIGLIAGGLGYGDAVAKLKPLGDLFIRLLKMLVMPIILASLVVGAASISPARLGRVGIKIVAYYLMTSAFAVFFGLLMGNIFKPGLGLELGVGEGKVIQATKPSLVDTLLNIVPKNPFAAFSNGQVLPTIFFAIVLGIALSYLMSSKDERIKSSATTLYKAFDGLAEAMYLIVMGVMQYAPIGVFALMAYIMATQGTKVVGPLAKVTFAVYLGLVLQIGIVYGIFMKLFGRE